VRNEAGEIFAGMMVMQDVTERKQAENLRDRLIAIIEATPDFIASATPAGEIVYFNRSARQVLGLPPEGAIDWDISQCHPPWATQIVWEQGIPTARGDGTWLGETALLSSDGREIPISQRIIAHRNGEGQISLLSTIARDITEQKQTEANLREAERRWRSLLENVHLLVVSLDCDGRIEWVNRGFVRITGYYLDEVKGRKPGSFLQGAQTDPRTVEALRTALGARQPYRGEILNYRRDGEPYWLAIAITPIFDRSGNLTQFIAVESDVTERKQMEAALRHSEAKNRSLIEAIPDLIFRLDSEGTILDYFPPKQSSDFQASAEMVGRAIDAVFCEDLAAWTGHYLSHVLKTGASQQGEYVLSVEGRYRHYEARYVPSGEGEVLAIVRDISERKSMEVALRMEQIRQRQRAVDLENALQQLKRTQTQLIQAEKMSGLGQMVAGVAHEINNPLSFIYGNLMHFQTSMEDLMHLTRLYRKNYPEPSREIADFAAEIDLVGDDAQYGRLVEMVRTHKSARSYFNPHPTLI